MLILNTTAPATPAALIGFGTILLEKSYARRIRKKEEISYCYYGVNVCGRLLLSLAQ